MNTEWVNDYHETIHAAKARKLARHQCPDLTVEELDALGIPDCTGTARRREADRRWRTRRNARAASQ